MSTENIRTRTSYLPPLPPIVAAVPAPRASDRGENLLMAITVLLVGTTVLAWTIRLSNPDGLFVSTAAVLTVVLPLVVFTLLRAASRRR